MPSAPVHTPPNYSGINQANKRCSRSREAPQPSQILPHLFYHLLEALLVLGYVLQQHRLPECTLLQSLPIIVYPTQIYHFLSNGHLLLHRQIVSSQAQLQPQQR